jgi:ABC-type branched-subunit amino acid transport system ATPase component
MIIELDNVELYYQSKPILSNLYLKVETNCLTTVIGRNGSGKSSLLGILFGDIRPKYRLIRIDGVPVTKPLYTLGNIKMLPEFPMTPGHLSIKTAFKKYQVSWDLFKSFFPEFKPTSDHRFKILSTGERRLLEVFMVLKSRSEIVLLDEPFKSLSPIVVERFKKLILEEKQQKVVLCADNRDENWQDIAEQTYLLQNRTLVPLA